MNIWKLSILNEDAIDWNASIYKGDVFVRAENEHDARRLASQRFCITKGKQSDGTVAAYPWMQKHLVLCEPAEDKKYAPTGEKKVLSPDDSELP